jgi:hypothetical protein
MNKKIAFMTLALLIGASFVGSCGDDKDETPQPQQQEGKDSSYFVSWVSAEAFNVPGWTSATHVPPQGGQQFFKDFYATGDSSTIEFNYDKDLNNGLATLTYFSSVWGVAVFENIDFKIEEDEEGARYILPDSLQSTIVMNRGAMGQQGGGGVYPITLLKSSLNLKTGEIFFVMSAFMNENHGSYELTFHRGDAPNPTVE